MSASSGFSLLEMLVVLTMMAILGAVAAPSMSAGLGGARVRAAAIDLANAVRRARSEAARGADGTFTIDVAAKSYRVGRDGPDVPLPAGTKLKFETALEGIGQNGSGRLHFFADGTSQGARIELENRGATWTIAVNWLTGAVVLAPDGSAPTW